MSFINDLSSLSKFSKSAAQIYKFTNHDGHDAAPPPGGGSLRQKRPALAELGPVNSKRTNVYLSAANGGIQAQVTPVDR
jgi:hypothetical protein